MIQIVKGNDAPIEWRVSLNGQPLDLTGKAVSLYVINSRGPFQLKDFKVEGNVVTCTYYGADQTRFGAHSLILRLNEGLPEMSTVAVKEAFELVEWSKDQGGENGEPIKVTPVIIEADVAVAQGGSDMDPSDYLTREEFNERIEGYATHDSVQELSENVTELSAEVSEKQDTISDLETIRSGAAKGATAIQEVKTINGQSIVGSGNIEIQGGGGGMATPSGDPMHYMFEAVGATYNATDEDIPMVGIYGDSYVHKAKHWHLNELGDITNEEMRVIYNERYPIPSNKYIAEWFRQSKGRTTLSALESTTSITGNNIAREGAYETLKLDAIGKEISVQNLGDAFYKAINCKKILNVINISSLTNTISAPIGACAELEEFRFKGLKANGLAIQYNTKVSKASFLYLIENEGATSPITIKVSNAQYDVLTNDADIQAALTAHPNVSLAK